MSVLDKIQSLKRLSENKSATPAEAANAAARVQELMLKHQISEADLGVEEDVEWNKDPIYSGVRPSAWRSFLATGIASLNGCRVLRGTFPNGSYRATLVGRKGDVEQVRYLFEFVSREIERLWARYRKTMEYATRPGVSGRTAGNSYRLGAVQVVLDRLKAQKDATTSEAAAAGQSGALVRLDERDAAVQAWLAKHAPDRHQTPPKAIAVDTMAWQAGRRDGATITTVAAVETAGAAPALV